MRDRSEIDAPGLKWRRRKEGESVPYWVARSDIAARGFEPKTVRLRYPANDIEAISARCRVLQAEMLEWSKVGYIRQDHAPKGSLAELVDLYQSSEFSPYRRVKWNTRRTYDDHCRKLKRTVGQRQLSAITYADIHRWHGLAKRPKTEGGPEQIRSAHGLMTMLRIVIGFGVLMDVPHAAKLSEILKKARFEMPAPRHQRPTLEQVRAIMERAHEVGAHSIAFGQALQFDGMFLQSDVTGQWAPAEEGAGGIVLNDRRWTSGLTWSHLDANGLIVFETTKTGRRVEIDTTLHPLIKAEIERVPATRRVGPMILDERSGRPYAEKEYGKRWRKFATAAGVPNDVWNRDSRAGGITEGRDAGEAVEDVSKQAAHSDPRVTSRVYDRGELEAARRIANIRSAHRQSKLEGR